MFIWWKILAWRYRREALIPLRAEYVRRLCDTNSTNIDHSNLLNILGPDVCDINGAVVVIVKKKTLFFRNDYRGFSYSIVHNIWTESAHRPRLTVVPFQSSWFKTRSPLVRPSSLARSGFVRVSVIRLWRWQGGGELRGFGFEERGRFKHEKTHVRTEGWSVSLKRKS